MIATCRPAPGVIEYPRGGFSARFRAMAESRENADFHAIGEGCQGRRIAARD
jgi:hypothetical protein